MSRTQAVILVAVYFSLPFAAGLIVSILTSIVLVLTAYAFPIIKSLVVGVFQDGEFPSATREEWFKVLTWPIAIPLECD